MASADGRYVMAYNGEVYNFAALREQLEPLGHTFRGHSDTEVLLAAILQWGVEDTLQRCNGMFAIALWDRQDRCLWLARDRVGKKPLYYGWAGDTLVFGSELKALWQHPAFDNDIDRDALTLLLRLDYIPAPHSIHQRCYKLMPGRVLRLDAAAVAAGAAAHRPEQAQRPYWDARARMQAALAARSRAASRRPRNSWIRCCAMRWRCAWWPTCRSACSCPAARTHRWWQR